VIVRLRSTRSRILAAAVTAIVVGAGIGVGLAAVFPRTAPARGAAPGATQAITVEPAQVKIPLRAFRLPGLVSPARPVGSAQVTGLTVINFWASWCVACRAEARTLQRAWRDYHGRGVAFIGIDTRDTRAAGIAFERRYGVSFPSGFDPAGSVSAQYGLAGLPDTLIVDPHRTVRYLILGALDEASFRRALDQALTIK